MSSRVRFILAALIFFSYIPSTFAAEKQLIYRGKWITTNRHLEGVMTCTVTHIGPAKINGHFVGDWQGVHYDYNAIFSGTRTNLNGSSNVDGVTYKYAARIDEKEFLCNFNGRYLGYFDLRRVK